MPGRREHVHTSVQSDFQVRSEIYQPAEGAITSISALGDRAFRNWRAVSFA